VPSLAEALQKVASSTRSLRTKAFPAESWEPWRFPFLPEGFWLDTRRRDAFLSVLAKIHSFKRFADWETLTLEQVRSAGGRSLVRAYGESIPRALGEFYPSARLRPWRFQRPPPRFWSEVQSFGAVGDALGRRLDWRRYEDVRTLTLEAMVAEAGRGLRHRCLSSPRTFAEAAWGALRSEAWDFDKTHQARPAPV
jgi:hypothetical protein